MYTEQRYWIGVWIVIANLIVVSFPATAIDEGEVKRICFELLTNPESGVTKTACLDAMNKLAAERGPSPAVVNRFPLVETAVPSEKHDGDREALLESLDSSDSVDILVEFDVATVRDEIHGRAFDEGLGKLGPSELAEKRTAYRAIKNQGLSGLAGVTVLREFENLSTSYVRVTGKDALNALMARPEVRTVRENRHLELTLALSLPLVSQPAAAAAGHSGAGTTVAVLDSGVLWNFPPFSCTAPGDGGCQVVDIHESAIDDGSLLDTDPDFHGTNVSSIVASFAEDANLVVADITDPTGAPTVLAVEDAINWIIGLPASMNIVAVNMSFGDAGQFFSGTCSNGTFSASAADALAAGIQPIVSSGNSAFALGGFVDFMSPPACAPSAVSVGAVYDGDVNQQINAPGCIDGPTTAPDQVACFSQTSPLLSLYAPGIFITAGPGPPLGGTSQAAPHVAGAWAVMSAAMPNATGAEILTLLQNEGDDLTDTRPTPDRTTARLNLFEALDADKDDVLFSLDDCTDISNAGVNQLDADHDGFGNICDGDLDQDGFTLATDVDIVFQCFNKSVPTSGGPADDPTCEESDLNGDGFVLPDDVSIIFDLFNTRVGPSGLACVTSPPTDNSCL